MSLRILSASAELAPLARSGGLGEAVAGLAGALAARGHEVVCALPAYRAALEHPDCPPLRPTTSVRIALPDRVLAGRWLEGALPSGAALRLLDLPALYDRQPLYDDGAQAGPEAALRFVAFARAVASLAADERPDVLVAHDWHAALSLCLLRTLYDRGLARAVGTVQVVHNNAYQGVWSASVMPLTGLPDSLFHPDGLEFYGDLCLLKGGLLWADRIVAVSPGYARELQTPEFGERLEGAYRFRSHRLVGIANGIDTAAFDPARDPALASPFSARAPAGKARCRKALLAELELEDPEPGRLLIAIGRFVQQKGWDILAEALDPLVAEGASLALLGDGERAIAAQLRTAARRHPGRIALHTGWDEALARRSYAGGDAVLIPSRFEPCGLVQLIAQRYATLPIARRTGGLGDTIVDGESGVLFDGAGAAELVKAVECGVTLFRTLGAAALRRKLLGLDVSWRRPAERWEALLSEVCAEARGRL